MAELEQVRMTSTEYHQLPETNRIEELIDGELVVTPPALDNHQEISGDVYSYLRQIIQGGVLRYAPTGIHFDDGNDFEPDIFWISPENDRCVLDAKGLYWHGAPDLIVEILSPSRRSVIAVSSI